MMYPVILCGGSGTQLWPSSRESYPKQFTKFNGEDSLFQKTLLRLNGSDFEDPILLTGTDYRFIAAEQSQQMGFKKPKIILEPEGRNTAPAILTAALALQDTPDALMLVMPSDHVIKNEEAFVKAVTVGIDAANAGKLVTFGIKAVHPETGYGYLELADPLESFLPWALPLQSFVEKPNLQKAQEFVAQRRYLWNAGIFLFRVCDILKAFEEHAAHLMIPCRRAIEGGQRDLDFLRLDVSPYKQAENISIDFAVMEKCNNLSVIPTDCGWCDMGNWRSVWREEAADDSGVVVQGSSTAIDCQNTLLRCEDDGIELVGIGLENITAVATGDAILVADMSRSEDVKIAVDKLSESGARQAKSFPKDHRPWGYFETLSLGERFQVKQIVVHPGAALSLQSHVHRSEHWIVVHGSANVTVDDEVSLVSENQSVYIPLGAVHRLENPGKVPLHLIEVQTGAYLGEDDIVRYEDIYARTEAA